jgi:acyl-CoA dehydrogenase
MTLTRGWASLLDPAIPNSSDHRKIAWGSASFAFLADIGLTTLGGGMKRKEKITGRYADAFAWLVMATAVIRRYDMDSRPDADRDFYRWAMDYAFHKIQEAFDGLYRNFPVPGLGSLLKWTMGTWSRFNRIGKPPSDRLGHRVSRSMQEPSEARRRRTEGLFDGVEGDALSRLEKAFRRSVEADEVLDRVKEAVRSGELPDGRARERVDEAVEEGIISEEDRELIEEAEELRTEVVQVDEFPMEEFENHSLS